MKMDKVRWLDINCPKCSQQLNSWDVRCSKALGYRIYQVCEKCLCKEYDMTKDEFRRHMEDFLGLRPCMGI